MFITLLNVHALTGLIPYSDESLTLYSYEDRMFYDLNLSDFLPKTFVRHFIYSGGNVTKEEHAAFLLYWLSRYVFCVPSNLISKEFGLLAVTLASESDYPLGKMVLATLFRSITDFQSSLSIEHPDPFSDHFGSFRLGSNYISRPFLMHFLKSPSDDMR